MSSPAAGVPTEANGSRSSTLSKSGTTRSLKTYLRAGHVSTFLSLLTAVSATRHAPDVVLPLHSAVAVVCAVWVRLALALLVVRRGRRTDAVAAGIFHALSASAVFSSAALHAVAATLRPPHLLPLIASSALDVSALWMRMASKPDDPRPTASPLFAFAVYTAADVLLAAVIAFGPEWANVAKTALAIRAGVNVLRLAKSSVVILARDTRRNDDTLQTVKEEHAE